MRLWSRLAQIQSTQSQQQPPFANDSITGHRPHQVTPSRIPPSSFISALLSGKHTPAYPTSGSTLVPLLSSEEIFTPQQALLATMVSQTLLQQFSSAFWQAFTGNSSSETNSHAPTWDTDKIRRVLEGKAVIKIIDLEPEEKAGATPIGASIPALSNGLEARECTKDSALATVLEDGMRALSLGKK